MPLSARVSEQSLSYPYGIDTVVTLSAMDGIHSQRAATVCFHRFDL